MVKLIVLAPPKLMEFPILVTVIVATFKGMVVVPETVLVNEELAGFARIFIEEFIATPSVLPANIPELVKTVRLIILDSGTAKENCALKE